jgi:hypothetical protein
VACETRTIGPLVLTVPVLRRLGFRAMVHRQCPIAEPAALDHGLGAALVTQSRLSDPTALDALPGWAERWAIAALYPESERTGQVNAAWAGRTFDALDAQRAVIWGDLIAHAAQHEALAWHRLQADTLALPVAGLLAAPPASAGVPRLEPGSNPAGAWLQPLKRCAWAAGDGGLPGGVPGGLAALARARLPPPNARPAALMPAGLAVCRWRPSSAWATATCRRRILS